MKIMPLWDLIVLFRDALVNISNTIQNILNRPLLSYLVSFGGRDVKIGPFNLTQGFADLLIDYEMVNTTLFEILIGGGLMVIVGLVIVKKLIPLF